MKILLGTGAALVALSVYMIVQIKREEFAESKIEKQLHVGGTYSNLAPRWKGHSISLSDDARPDDPSAKVIQPWGHKERPGRVTIMIDGKDFSWPCDIAIRPESNGELNRYHHGILMGPFIDHEEHSEEFLIVQRCEKDGQNQYRVLRLSETGQVHEEIFSHAERAASLKRTFFVGLVYPELITVNRTYPSFLFMWPLAFWYPVEYSVAIGIIGIALLLMGFFVIRSRRHRA